MKFLRSKIISGVAVLILLSVNIYGAVLYNERTEQTITKGASLIKEKVLTHEGWQDINILKVSLQDENISIRPIESGTLGERKTILDLANGSGAIAGVNSDFFDTSTVNTPSFGPVISDGNLKHAYNNNFTDLGPAKNMATLLIDENNMPLMAYYGVAIKLFANGEEIGGMATYNNLPGKLAKPIVLDSTYQKNTAKALSKYKGIYTVVIDNGQVTYLSKQDEVVTIPQNGYVILVNTNDANAYYSKLPVGTLAEIKSFVYLNDNTTRAIEEIKLGVGGSGILMRDGLPYTGPSHSVSGTTRAPRTVVATRNNYSELLLITIDGRGKSLGANQSDLVSLLQSYNVQDAMYFDGGGSTTLVSRTEGEKEVKVQNTPSDGSQRKVVNGVGVFTNSQPGAASTLYLDTASPRTFVGEPITFTVKAVDANYNPADVSKAGVKLTVSGVSGSFKGLTFNPSSAGKALVIASYNGVETAKEVYITDKPAGIRVEPSNMQVNPGSSKTVAVYGIDKEGYKILLSPDKITWKSSNPQVSVSQSKVTAKAKGLAVVTASYKDLSSKLGVIAGDAAVPLDSLEKNEMKWGGDTATVKGKVEPSKELKYHGNRAFKMTYTFNKSADKQVAGMLFNTPVQITNDAMSVNMWVYAKSQGDAAKIELTDAKGKKFYLKITDQLNFEGWKYFSVSLPQGMAFPVKLNRFYVVSNGSSEDRTSIVCLDHISITRGFRDKRGITVRDDNRFDALYKESLQAPKGEEYQINIIGTTKPGSMILDKEADAKVAQQLSKDAKAIIFTSQNNAELAVTAAQHAYSNSYKTADFNNTKVVFAGTDRGGLRATDANAWLNIKKEIESADAKNIILVMGKNPLTQFEDAEEGRAFHKYLRTQRENTGKNIFVIYSEGNENDVRIEDGIRYMRTSGLASVTESLQEGSFLKFKIVGSNIYYTFEKFN